MGIGSGAIRESGSDSRAESWERLDGSGEGLGISDWFGLNLVG